MIVRAIAALLLYLVVGQATAATGDLCGGTGQPACPEFTGNVVSGTGGWCTRMGAGLTVCNMATLLGVLGAAPGENWCVLRAGSSDYTAGVHSSGGSAAIFEIASGLPPLSPVSAGATFQLYSGIGSSPTCSGGAASGQIYFVAMQYGCGDGTQVTNPGTCSLIMCTDKRGKFIDFQESGPGPIDNSSGAGTQQVQVDERAFPGHHVCINGCRVRAISAGCTWVALSSSTGYVQCDGTGLFLGEGCIPADKVIASSFTANERGLPGETSTMAGVSGGGAGATGGTDPNSINLARIATNTARMADATAANRPIRVVIDPSSEGGTGGGSCGGPGQPACVTTTTINEGGTAGTTAGMSTGMDGSKTAMQDALQGTADSLTFKADRFGTSEGRYTFGLGPFLSVGTSCELELGPISFGTWYNVPSFKLSICSWAGDIRQVLAWAVYVLTAVGLWAIVFRS